MGSRRGSIVRRLDAVVAQLGRTGELDRAAQPVADAVARARPEAAVGLVSGTWIGHPLHPPLTDLPIGFWTSAWVLDIVGGRESRDAARTLVGLGVASALPAVVTGLSDWSDTVDGPRRIGFVHATVNTIGLACYTASWLARRRGHHATGVSLGMAGAAAATLAAYLGGHLVYRTGTGVDVNACTEPPGDWVRADAAEVLVTQDATGWHAIGDRCSHRGGPLHEGTIEDGCVTCPWHGSRFRTDDGTVVRGPAVSPQPAYEVRQGAAGPEVRARV
jgi:nitrite reductase/ring-hydroxylating ferredoxin subunit